MSQIVFVDHHNEGLEQSMYMYICMCVKIGA